MSLNKKQQLTSDPRTSSLNGLEMGRPAFIILFVLLSIASLMPLWSARYIPSQNSPLYVLVTQIFKEYHNIDFNFSENFKFVFMLVPNLFFHFLVYLLAYAVPILTAYKMVISITMVLLPVSVFYFIHAIDPRRTIWGFISFIYVYNYYLFKGYDSFFLSFSVFLFYVAYLVKNHQHLQVKNYLVLAMMALLIYFTHIFTFLMAILTTFLYMFAQHRDLWKSLKIMAVFIPGLLAFLQYVTVLFTHSNAGNAGSLIRYAPPQETIQEFLYLTMYSYTQWTVIFFLVPLLFVLFSLGKTLSNIRQHYLSGNKEPGNRFYLLLEKETMLFLTIALLVFFFLAPREIIGWPKFNTRFLPFMVFFLLVSVERPESKLLRRLFLGSSLIMSMATYILMGQYIVKINDVYEDYTSGIAVIEKNKILLPVHIKDFEVGKIKPLNWAFSYYNVFKGGTTNRVLAYTPGRVPLEYRYPVRDTLPFFKPDHPEKADIHKIQAIYDYVLFWGNNRQIFDLFENNGYKLIHEKGELKLYARGSTE